MIDNITSNLYTFIYIYYCEISYLIKLNSYRIWLTSNRLDKIRRTSTRESNWNLWSVQSDRTLTRGSDLNFCPKPNPTARLVARSDRERDEFLRNVFCLKENVLCVWWRNTEIAFFSLIKIFRFFIKHIFISYFILI